MATPRIGLTKNTASTTLANRIVNDGANIDALDDGVVLYIQDDIASRPAAGIEGRYFWSTDESLLYYDDGSVWHDVSSYGDVAGPGSFTDSDIAEFDGIKGKIIKDGGLTHANVADAVTKRHAANIWGTKEIDETNIGDGKVPVYRTPSGKYELEARSGGLPYKTVGPYSWCDYETDGSADQSEINTALATGYPVMLVGAISITGSINIPTSGNPELFGSMAVITVASNSADPVIADNSGVISNAKIHDLVIDAGGYSVSGVQCDAGAINCNIYNLTITGITQADSNGKLAIQLSGDVKNCAIHSNYIYNCIVFSGIFCAGFGNVGSTSGNTIYGNRIYRSRAYGTQQTQAIMANNAAITSNVIESWGLKTQDYGTSTGDGIHGERSTILGNIVVGTGHSGIVPGVNCTVCGNRIIAPGANGIDFWYSSYSVISGNQILFPGNNDMGGDWDQSAIDMADHSAFTLVTGNYCNGDAATVADTLAATANNGTNYIRVSDFAKWYSGMRIKIGSSDKYRIDYIDYTNNRIYLTTNLSSTYVSGTAVVGVNCMTVGICVGDNGQSDGTHIVTNNYIYQCITDRYLPFGASMLEYTYIDDYMYTTALPWTYAWNRHYTLHTGGKYYSATYVYGVGTKKVEMS